MNLSKYYGKFIVASCACCWYGATEQNGVVCQKGKAIRGGECSAFQYEPTLREPKVLPPLVEFDPNDFKL